MYKRNRILLKCSPWVLGLYLVIYSQSNISLSGTVLDNITNAAIQGATVRLIGKNLTSSTDTHGLFTISSTLTSQKLTTNRFPEGIFRNKSGVFFNSEIGGSARMCVFNLSGGLCSVVFSGNLEPGLWKIHLPLLSSGLYLFRIDSPGKTYSMLFPASDGKGMRQFRAIERVGTAENINVAAGYSICKQVVKNSAIDSLLVTRPGYAQCIVPIDNFTNDSLRIFLADTAAASSATIVPDTSWTCFMPDGIPPPERGIEVFRITLQYSAIHNVGMTKFGHRRLFDISGGSITGNKISGTFLTGGLEYELTLSTGSIELEQINILRANNIPILMRNAGVAPAGARQARIVLDFEAPNSSSFAWLNTGKFAATRIVDTVAKTIQMNVYDIASVSLTTTRIKIKDSAGVPNQTWDCLKWTGSQGSSVLTENVTLGASVSIGASKRGNRNIIPITGGTTTGRVTGKILSGGADYQLSGLDARYALAPNDGEFIIVRNCGVGALVPVFEARIDGPYAFLNENKYLSSSPAVGANGVSITFYERD